MCDKHERPNEVPKEMSKNVLKVRGLATMCLTLYSLQYNGTLEFFPRNQIDLPSTGTCLGWIYHFNLTELSSITLSTHGIFPHKGA